MNSGHVQPFSAVLFFGQNWILKTEANQTQ